MRATLATSLLSVFVVSCCLSVSACAAGGGPRFGSRTVSFGFKMLSELAKTKPGKNVFISPASLSLALSMTLNGASGETESAMTRVLGFDGLTLDEVNQGNCALLEKLASPGLGVRLDIANSLWGRKGIVFKQDFLDRNRQFYRAEVHEVEFGPAAIDSINSWVKSKTQEKIPEIIKQMPVNPLLFLINAVYFKGQWQESFDQNLTTEAPFTLPDDEKITVQMMSRRGSYNYLSEPGLQVVSIPYGEGRVSMYILLPNKLSGLTDLICKIDEKTWQRWMDGLRTTEVALSLPRFKIEYGVEDELKTALQAMGMAIAFDPENANFSNMCVIKDANVFISQVAHKTFIEVNEEGTEAAAATSVGMSFTAAPLEPVRMIVDRPFLCAIRENETGALLFLGAIINPQEKL